MDSIMQKYRNLLEILSKYEKMLIAFSGGVDSSFLLYAAKQALGDRMAAVTAESAFFPRAEQAEAAQFCAENGIRQITFEADVLSDSRICSNPADRCYFCKRKLFFRIRQIAAEDGFSAVAEGSNSDDRKDYRPGLKAVSELGILSPLCQASLTKSEIRSLSKIFGLPTWNKPSAACLASRIPYGDLITREKLRMAELAEQYLHELGFGQVRVRIHGNVARIEAMPDELEQILRNRTGISERFREIGFSYTALDLLGYRTGSLNETLKQG